MASSAKTGEAVEAVTRGPGRPRGPQPHWKRNLSPVTEPVKAQIIAGHIAGANKSEIARAVNVSRPTVIRVLTEAQVDKIALQAKSILIGALPVAAETIARTVGTSAPDSWELLDRTGAMPKRDNGVKVGVAVAFSLGTPSLYAKAVTEAVTVEAEECPPLDK